MLLIGPAVKGAAAVYSFQYGGDERRGIAWFLIPADIGEIVEKNPGDQLVFIMEMIIKGSSLACVGKN